MKFKRILSFLLSLTVVVTLLSGMCTVFASDETESVQTYGYDNIFDTSKDLTVAYLGGSITEQVGYVENSFAYFQQLKQSQGREAKLIKAGVGGTTSSLGLYRLKHQILDKKPDILFVEFCVNDRNRGAAAAQDMEGIVRMCMESEHQPSIIFVISMQTDYDVIASMANRYKVVADYYNVGFIDFAGYLKPLVDNGTYIWEANKTGTLTGDGTHPNSAGHKVYGDYIIDRLKNDNENVLKKLTYKAEALSSYVHGEPKMVAHNDPNVKYTGDGWISSDTATIADGSRLAKTLVGFPRFEQGYHEFKTYEGMTAPTVEYTFTGRAIGIYAMRGDSGAKYSYVIDEGTADEKKGTASNYYKHNVKEDVTETSVGTQMTCPTFFMENLKYGEHTLKFTLLEPETQNGYTQDMFAFGYFMIDDVKPKEIPTATDITVSGKQKTHQTLSASYTFKNIGNTQIGEGTSTYRWLRSDKKYGTYTAIENQTSLKYTTTEADKQKYIKLEITPVNAENITGPKVYSDPMYIRDRNKTSSEIIINSALLGKYTLSEKEENAPELTVAEAIAANFNVAGLIDDFGYNVTFKVSEKSDSAKIAAYAQMKSGDDDGTFAFTMKPSKKLEKGKTYEVSVGGKNVSTIKKYYFKTADSKYTLSVSAIGGSVFNVTENKDMGSSNTSVYTSVDKKVTLKAMPDDNAEFLYWKDTGNQSIISTDNEIKINIGSGRKLMAVFAEKEYGWLVTFKDTNGKEISSFYVSEDVTVPQPGYVMGYNFLGWIKDNDSTNPIAAGTVIKKDEITKNTVFTAGRVIDSKLYNVEINGADSIGGSFKYNTKITVKPAGENGKVFAYWKKNSQIVSYDEEYTFFVNGDGIVEAVYADTAPEREIIIKMEEPVLVDSNRIAFFAERNVADELSVIESGILLSDSEKIDIDNCKYKVQAKNLSNCGQFTIRKKDVKSGEVWYAVAYVITSDGTNAAIKYSNTVKYEVK